MKNNKLCRILLLLAFLTGALIACSRSPHSSSGEGMTEVTINNLTITNLKQIYILLRLATGEGDTFPISLGELAKDSVNSNLFVCPGTGHDAGSMRTVEEWTDYIYVGSQPELCVADAALVISPPENYGGKYGIVLFAAGYISKLSADQVRLLVEKPWLLASNAPRADLDQLKKTINVRVPKWLQPYYSKVN